MRRTVHTPLAFLVAAGVLAGAAVEPAHAADRKDKSKKLDLIYVHPDYASFGVQSIALLPPVTFDGSLTAEKTVGISTVNVVENIELKIRLPLFRHNG